MAKRKSKLALQKGLVALIGVVSISVLGYFTFIVVDDQTNARFEEGTHFETLATRDASEVTPSKSWNSSPMGASTASTWRNDWRTGSPRWQPMCDL